MKMYSDLVDDKDKLRGTVDTYANKPVVPPLEYTFDAKQYENITEAKASEDWLGDNEILKVINTKMVTAAKAKEYQKITKSLKDAAEKAQAEYEKTWEYKRERLITATMAMGLDRATAEAFADSTPEAAKNKSVAA